MESSLSRIDPVDSARAQFIGFMLNWGLYGILTAQTFSYYMFFPHDLGMNKAIAFSVFSLESLQTTLLTRDIYLNFVINPGNGEALEMMRLLWLTVPVLCGLVGWIAEMFYAYRIFKVSRSRRVSGIIMVLSFVQLASGIAEGIRARSVGNLITLRGNTNQRPIPVIVWTVSMTMCDTTIAVTMTYYLVRLKREFQRSSYLIRKLMTLTVETGTITALTSAVCITLFIKLPDKEIFNIGGFIMGKLYSNSLMRILNSRNQTESTGDVISFPVSYGEASVLRQVHQSSNSAE